MLKTPLFSFSKKDHILAIRNWTPRRETDQKQRESKSDFTSHRCQLCERLNMTSLLQYILLLLVCVLARSFIIWEVVFPNKNINSQIQQIRTCYRSQAT